MIPQLSMYWSHRIHQQPIKLMDSCDIIRWYEIKTINCKKSILTELGFGASDEHSPLLLLDGCDLRLRLRDDDCELSASTLLPSSGDNPAIVAPPLRSFFNNSFNGIRPENQSHVTQL